MSSKINQLDLRYMDSISYEQLGAKLSYFCNKHFGKEINIRIIVAFSELDYGRGNAILTLTKQFGSFPLEVCSPKGELDMREFTELSDTHELTLIIQTFPLVFSTTNHRMGNKLTNVNFDRKVNNLDVHIPQPSGLDSELSRSSLNLLMEQVGLLSSYFTQDQINPQKKFLYLSGFSYLDIKRESGGLPESKIIPWYFLIVNGKKNKRIYRQPELNDFLESLYEEPPKIDDLEEIIASIDDSHAIDND